MVTRRSKQANRTRTSPAVERRQRDRARSKGKTIYVGDAANGARGGRVGNIAGLGTDSTGGGRNNTPSINNVAGLGTDATDVTGQSYHDPNNNHGKKRRRKKSPTYRSRKADQNGGALVSRRGFLYGAAAVGAVAVVGAGAGVAIYQSQSSDDDEDSSDSDVSYLEVSEDAVTSSESCTSIEAEDCLSLLGSYELPYGTMVWANDDAYAACLLPCETSSPLTQIGLLSLADGSYSVVVEEAVGTDEGFEIYDVRATSSGLVWTECDILDDAWRIYTAVLTGGVAGAPVLADEGDTVDWDTPTIAAVGSYAFWQVVPKTSSDLYSEGSSFKRATMGASDASVIYTCRGRMATPPYGLADAVVITPRLDYSTVYYQLTLLDAATAEIEDTMTLPYSMTPLEAGYGETGFMFSFENIYSYGDGISNLGTYTPKTAVTDGAYSDAPWFHFYRTPTAAPAWCGPYFIVKSTSQVCGFDFDTDEYFALELEDGCDDYGEYLASTGSRDLLVTYTNVDDDPIDGEARECCVVKVWTPIA